MRQPNRWWSLNGGGSERVGVCKNVKPTGSGTSSDNGKGGELDTAEPEEIAQDKCSQGASLMSDESDLAHRSEDLEEKVDTRSTMVVTEGDLFYDKQMTLNKKLRAANPKKRGIRVRLFVGTTLVSHIPSRLFKQPPLYLPTK